MYAKLFASIYQGTLRGNTHGLVVFTNLLAHADLSGCVDIHPMAISDEVGLTLAEVQAALLSLESPDAESRSPEEDGRRIVRLNEHRSWGWRIVNHGKYRSIRNEEDRREQNRRAQEKFRNKIKENNSSKPRKPKSAHTDTDTDTDTDTELTTKTTRAPRFDAQAHLVALGVSPDLATDWIEHRKSVKAKPSKTAIEGIAREAEKANMSLSDALRESCSRGWRGFKAEWMRDKTSRARSWQDKKQASDSATWAAINGTDNANGVTYEAGS